MADASFVDVLGALEPAAIAGAVAELAHRRVAEALVLAERRLALDELRRIELLATASLALDGFEHDVLALVGEHAERIRAR